MSRCPEAEYRASLSDADFWAHVLQHDPANPETDDGPDIDDLALTTNQGTPCPECGEYVVCAYDSQGRAMTHVIESDDS